MAERLARTRANAGHNPAPSPQPAAPAGPTVTHCWFAGPHGRLAALLLGWRKVTPNAIWEGHIVHAVPDDDGWTLITEWVDAGMLERA